MFQADDCQCSVTDAPWLQRWWGAGNGDVNFRHEVLEP